MGSPVTGSWDSVVDAAYYAGQGQELWWLLISIALCVLACWWGHRHEAKANAD